MTVGGGSDTIPIRAPHSRMAKYGERGDERKYKLIIWNRDAMGLTFVTKYVIKYNIAIKRRHHRLWFAPAKNCDGTVAHRRVYSMCWCANCVCVWAQRARAYIMGISEKAVMFGVSDKNPVKITSNTRYFTLQPFRGRCPVTSCAVLTFIFFDESKRHVFFNGTVVLTFPPFQLFSHNNFIGRPIELFSTLPVWIRYTRINIHSFTPDNGHAGEVRGWG